MMHSSERGFSMSVRALLAGLAASAVLLGAVRPAAAAATLRDEIRTALAKPIQDLLTEEKQEAVAIGEFTGPALLDTNAGPGVQQILAEELQALKVTVQKKANLSVKGRYAKVEDKESPGQIAVKLTAEVLDRNDERKAEFRALLRGTADIARLLGVTVSLPPPDEPGAGKARNQELDRRSENPQVHVDGSKVSASADSPYAVEVLVKAAPEEKAAPRAARVADGQAFVDVKRGELYELRLHNTTGSEAGVTVTIDGLDAFAFSEVRDPKTGRPRYSHYIVKPGGTATVVGWHLRDKPPDNYASFLVTEYGKGASARAVAQAQGQRGVITVTFAPAFEGKPRSSADETGLGPPRSVDVKPVQRSVGPVRETVSIRYTR
jgi:hypothetical protein